MKTSRQRFISLFLTALFLFLSGCFEPESPQDVAQEFWKAVITHNEENVVEYSTLVDMQNYTAFNKKWQGYQAVMGKIIIDGNRAKVETELSQLNDTGKNHHNISTYLVKQNEQWKVDYVRTAESMKADTFDNFFGQLDELGKKLSDTLKDSSDKFRIEMQRLENELKTFAQSTGDEANEIVKQYSIELKKSIKKLADSIDRALKEHGDDLSEDDKQKLLKVSDDLDKSQQNLSEPTVSNINQSSRQMSKAQEQLDEVNNEKIISYKKQWNDLQYRFERNMQSLLDALSKELKQ